jgi:hypothetical protein
MATTFTNEIAGAAPATAAETKPRQGILMRVIAAMMDSRQRAAEREVARYIMARGGVLTDSLERELGRKFGAPAEHRRD